MAPFSSSITGLENAMYQLITSFITVAVFIGLKQGFSVNVMQGNENWIEVETKKGNELVNADFVQSIKIV